jgi:hypothetical protein
MTLNPKRNFTKNSSDRLVKAKPEHGIYRLFSGKKMSKEMREGVGRKPVKCCHPGCEVVSRYTAPPGSAKYWCPKHYLMEEK